MMKYLLLTTGITCTLASCCAPPTAHYPNHSEPYVQTYPQEAEYRPSAKVSQAPIKPAYEPQVEEPC